MVRRSITTLLTADDQDPTSTLLSDRPSCAPRRAGCACVADRRQGRQFRRSRRRGRAACVVAARTGGRAGRAGGELARSEEHTSELQSLMRNAYALSCLKKKK